MRNHVMPAMALLAIPMASAAAKQELRVDVDRPGIQDLRVADASDSTALVLRWVDGNGRILPEGDSYSYAGYIVGISSVSPAGRNPDLWFEEAVPVFEGHPPPGPPGTLQSLTIRNLRPGTTYYAALRGYCLVPWGSGEKDITDFWSPLSELVEAVTPVDTLGPAQIVDLHVDRFDASAPGNGADLAWTAPGDDGASGRARRYILVRSPRPPSEFLTLAEWFDDAAKVETPPSPAPAGTTERFTFSAFSVPAGYYSAIRAFDEAGNSGAISNIVAVGLPPADPVAESEGGPDCAARSPGGRSIAGLPAWLLILSLGRRRRR